MLSTVAGLIHVNWPVHALHCASLELHGNQLASQVLYDCEQQPGAVGAGVGDGACTFVGGGVLGVIYPAAKPSNVVDS